MNNTERIIDTALDGMTKVGDVFAVIVEEYVEWCSNRPSTEAGVFILAIMPLILLMFASSFIPTIFIKLIMAVVAIGVAGLVTGVVRFLPWRDQGR